MGQYEDRLSKVVNEPGFKRLFYGECKNCGKKIWSVGEQIDVEKGVIKALFLCNCGAKFKRIVYTRDEKGGYKYPQGLVTDVTINGKKQRVIKSHKGLFKVTPEGIKVKPNKKEKKDEL